MFTFTCMVGTITTTRTTTSTTVTVTAYVPPHALGTYAPHDRRPHSRGSRRGQDPIEDDAAVLAHKGRQQGRFRGALGDGKLLGAGETRGHHQLRGRGLSGGQGTETREVGRGGGALRMGGTVTVRGERGHQRPAEGGG